MLIRFSVENFRSFKERNVFSLEMVGSKKFSDTNAFHCEGLSSREKLLKSAIIYGANASGKSNLVRAIATMKYIVLQGGISGNAIQDLLEPFLLTEKNRQEPVVFEIEFINNSRRYRYGFSCTNESIESEWLMEKRQRMRTLFIREKNNFTEKSSVFQELNAWNKVIENTHLSLSSEALFVSTAAKMFDGGICANVLNWFSQKLRVIVADDFVAYYGNTLLALKEGENTHEISRLIQKADLGITNLIHKIEEKPATEENGKHKRHFNAQIGTEHTINGRAYTLDMFRHESEGTKKIFALSSFLIDVLKTGKTLLIDELDARLHPLLLKHIIELFHDENLNGAQLIATSHSPSMLTENNFRRDQIWFMDKKADGGSHLVSLADFTHIRGNYHRIVQDYLRGCFGGVPYIQDLKVN